MGYLVAPKGFEREINYRPPVNMRPEWEHLFRPDHSYRKVKLGARLLRNVLMDRGGLLKFQGRMFQAFSG
jgi:hypothetical protein